MTIVDASVATAWFVSMATSRTALPVRNRPSLAAPELLKVELTSSLLKYVRAGVLEPAVLPEAIEEIGNLVEHWFFDAILLPEATRIALAHNHKIYDCLYLALAMQQRGPLATADRKLAALANKLSIETELIEPAL